MTCRVSRPVCALCSAISVAINALAPASSTKDAAICVTAKIRWRWLVLPVIRTLPLARLSPFGVPDEGRRGTNARITAATTASAAPTQSKLESTLKSSARTAQGACAGAQRHADRQLTFAANRPCQNQVGDIGTRDDEDQP